MTGWVADSPITGVVAIVVTFRPSLRRLDQLLASTLAQVDHLVIVDNGSPASLVTQLRARTNARMDLISLTENQGIAAAQNVGISHARTLPCTHVLLLDHDSVPAPDMVGRLLAALQALTRAARPVAAVGPRYADERQDNPPPFIRVRGLRLQRCRCDREEDVVEVDYLIASGSLIPMAAINTAGLMNEALFIDYVDIEWGLRARRHGLQSFGVCGARMAHDLGEQPVRFLGRAYPVHSPLRHYYHVRNAVWLYARSGLPLNWKIVDGWRLLLKFGFYSTMTPPRLQHASMMALGIIHGIVGRLGPLRSDRGDPPGTR